MGDWDKIDKFVKQFSGVWPHYKYNVIVNQFGIDHCTQDEFYASADRLLNVPKNTPDWVEYIALIEEGYWVYFEQEPFIGEDELGACWKCHGRFEITQEQGYPLRGWGQSMIKVKSEPLELPEEDFNKLSVLVNSEPNDPTESLKEIFKDNPDISIEV